MGKLLRFVGDNILKIGVSFLILFVAIYPKLPSIGIAHTWVYIRLEDFLISFLVIIWAFLFVKKKQRIPTPIILPIIFYWIAGLTSFLLSLVFVGPHIALFFPKIAALAYTRRIEYLILFFIGFSSVRSKKDVRDFFIIFCITILLFDIYGFGQRFYIYLWQTFPKFFETHPFCFPSYQTGNEEFAKGVPLCLPSDARITSTFAGHYDLAGYLVFAIPVILGVAVSIKKWFYRILLILLACMSLMLLVFTASRVSFLAYIGGAVAMLIFYKKKKFILPVLIVSIGVLLIFNGSTARRFLETIRFASIVTNNQGEVVGFSEANLPSYLKNKIAKNSLIEANIASQKLPEGTSFTVLPGAGAPIKTNVAVVKSSLSIAEAKRLKLANGGVEISTMAGSFLIQKALVYDISFTTRFQAEWPNAWKAFLRDPFFGSGYATITLASDNDYLRFLGESGAIGLISFISIFLILGITLKEIIPDVEDKFLKGFLFGLAGGIVGLALNAVMIDIFEASKIAETVWPILGIGAGILYVYKKKEIDYKIRIIQLISSHFFICLYFIIVALIVLLPSINNFFVGYDFVWLRFAASATTGSAMRFFSIASGSFYRPFDNLVMFFLYTFFSFQPQGYHLFVMFLHLTAGVGVYLLTYKIFGKKVLSLATGLIFLLVPMQGENIFWLSSLPSTLGGLFSIYGLLSLVKFRLEKKIGMYIFGLLFAILGLLSYEIAVIFPLLFVLCDLYIGKAKLTKQTIISYIPFFLLIPFYFLIRTAVNTFPLSGDYAYNMVHILPNVAGNFLGYVMLFLFGEVTLPLYMALRSGFRESAILITIVLLVGFVLSAGILYLKRHSMQRYFQNEKLNQILFGLLFAFVSLLPFLWLGNITERYGYLAAFGFAISLVLMIQAIVHVVFSKEKKFSSIFFLLCVAILSVLYYFELHHESGEWQAAGKITQKTLSSLRLENDSVPSNTHFIFIKLPAKLENAWVFPTGLEDGIWFIYRDPSIKVYTAKDFADALSIKATVTVPPATLVNMFEFDKNYDISLVSE